MASSSRLCSLIRCLAHRRMALNPLRTAARQAAVTRSPVLVVPPVAGPSRLTRQASRTIHSSYSVTYPSGPKRPPAPGGPQQQQQQQRAAPPPVNPLSYRDDKIPHRYVRLVDPETGHLGEPTALRRILDSYDANTHTLVLASLADPAPIVRLLNKEEERTKEREAAARSKLKRKIAIENKEVQVSWGSADGDLRHKAAVARAIIERGDRVELVLAQRSSSAGGERIDDERKAHVISIFEDAMADIASRWKEDEIRKGARVCHWQPLASVRAHVRDKILEKETSKMEEKQRKKEERRRREEEKMQRAAARRESAATD